MTILSRDQLNNFGYWLNEAKTNSALLLIDKPRNWTSFDVIAKIRSITRIKKIGHTGTLDPFATGLLILLFNRATKMQSEFLNLNKTYVAKLKLGCQTKTFDPTSSELNCKSIAHLSDELISSTILSFIGEYEQVPPVFSAKKIGGRRLYKIARNSRIKPFLNPPPFEKPTISELSSLDSFDKIGNDILQGHSFTLPAQKVKIFSIEILSIELPFVTIGVTCSKGTYIRSLANDIGNKLGVGAYLYDLRRTKIGDFFVDYALSLPDFIELIKNCETLQ